MIEKWPSPSKLNLFLYVIGRYSNGYHYLQTLFQFIEYGDSIEFLITNNNKIRLFSTVDKIVYHKNLIIQAATLLRNYCGSYKKNLGVDIILHKLLPIGSGLGGGSSNAATTLMVLNQKWKCYLNKDILMKLGLMLGADVPIFIHGCSSVSEGIGKKFTSVIIPERWYLIIIPSFNISTAYIFNRYRSIYRYSPYRSVQDLLKISFKNDLEPIVKKIFPEIKIYFQYLSQWTLTRITGTGSCIFSEFHSEYAAYQVQKYLPSWINSIVTKGMQISPLHQLLSKYN